MTGPGAGRRGRPTSSRSTSSGWGIVNGWWAGTGLPSSSRPSNRGKSTTHRKLRPPSVTGGRPSSSRSRPSTCRTTGRASATSSTRSPGSAASADRTPASSASDRNLATGLSSPWSVTRIHTRPLAPHRLAASVRSSSRLREKSPAPGTRMPFTVWPANALNPVVGEDVGQLDQLHAEPHIGLVGAVALHGLVPGHAGDVAAPRRRPPRRWRSAPRADTNASTSSWPTKLASTSSWVNSNWRSARRSSSRRHRAIW